MATESKSGITLGGRKTGSLTQRHYKKAVTSKSSSTEELRKKILMTFQHASSSDENPKHHECPTGQTSWCFWQRAIAHKQSPPTHKGKSTSFISEVKPIYDRLTSDVLLARCLPGMTQNANESIHAKIWSRCPKHIFVGRRRVEVGTALGVSEFNSGSVGLRGFLKNIGCSVSSCAFQKGKKRDAQRISKAEKA